MKIGIYQRYWGRVGGGQRYIGSVAEALAQRHDVEIVHHAEGFDAAAVADAMKVDLSNVGFRYVPDEGRPGWTTKNPLERLRRERDWQGEISAGYDLYVDNSDVPPFFCHAKQGVLVVHFPLMSRDEFHGRTTDVWERRAWPTRIAAAGFQDMEWRMRVGTYKLCIASSEYSRRWTQRRWGLDSRVLYPPLRAGIVAANKERLILTIGAFHHSGHKRFSVLGRCICSASRWQGLTGWRYVLAGSCGETAEDRAYLDNLRFRATGHPIEIRTDVSDGELRDLLGRASILWHGMGYGVDPERDPGLMEHFGMVVPEAQAAGCVPVVFRGGGLSEIVQHRVNGMLWSSVDALKDCTREVATNSTLRMALADAAQTRSEAFSQERFEANLLTVLAPVLT